MRPNEQAMERQELALNSSVRYQDILSNDQRTCRKMSNFHLQDVSGLKLIEFGPASTEAQGSRRAHQAQLGI